MGPVAAWALAAPVSLLSLFPAGALFPVGLAPIDDSGTAPKWRTAATCASCHPDQAAEWQHSRHGKAWTNAIFQREYKQQPLDWCVHCHAPLKSQFDEVRRGGGALADEGVTCAVCHVRGDKLLARRKHPASPHDTEVRADFGGPEFCAGCHQFNFPLFGKDGQVSGYSAFPMQNTVAQFRAHVVTRGADKEARCGDCHARSRSGHSFPGAHDPGMLQKALAYSLCRSGSGDSGELVVTLRNQGAGHNVPTGDVHRHILLRLWRSSSPERLYEHSLARRYQPVPGGGKRTVLDTTLPPGGERTLRIKAAQLGGTTGPAPTDGSDEPVSLELRYVYTIDEFPFRGKELAEPTYQTIASERLTVSKLPACAPPRRASLGPRRPAL